MMVRQIKAMAPITEFESQFAIHGYAQVVEGNGGLTKVRITSPAATGEMYLHGAHVTSWHPKGGEEVFFVSSKSQIGRGHL